MKQTSLNILKAKPALIICTLFGLIFLALLSVRVDLFRKNIPVTPVVDEQKGEKESWMNILQNDRKIGYSHRYFSPRENGYLILDSTYMRINTMGMVQDIHINTKGTLNADLSLRAFVFDLRSSLFHFNASGKVGNDILTVTVDDRKTSIPLKNPLYLTAGMMDAVLQSNLEPGQTGTYSIFDPATMGQRPVNITMAGNETIEIMGQKIETRKITMDFMGNVQTAWVDENNDVVQEKGFVGIKLVKVTRDEALKELTGEGSQDLTKLVSVPADISVENQDRLTFLKLKIDGIHEGIKLNGGRQTYKDGILTISKEQIPDQSITPLDSYKDFLGQTPFIQSENQDIKERVAKIISKSDSSLVKVQKLTAWIFENIEKRPVLSVPNALETLEKRRGDCNEHAVLLAAFCRAAGIPAQIEAGLVYMKGSFYYHAWNAVFLGKWITVDSLMNQIPADPTHIRIVRGEPDKQIDLIGVIGKIKIKVLEQTI